MIFNGQRNRLLYLLGMLVVIVLGLLSRVVSDSLPAFIAEYSGDTLWGLMVFIGFGVIFSSKTTRYVATVSFIFAFGIEISQLFHFELLMNLRSTTLGALILGHGFLWSDLVCYTVGILMGVVIEKIYKKKKTTDK